MARAHGIDVSKWQRYFDASVNPGDIQFIVIRTSYGMMTDESYTKLLESIQPVPLRGAYHYFSSGSPWEMQAKLYLNLVRDAGIHFHCLDIESAYNKRSAGFALAARKWMEHVRDATEQPVVLYTNPNIYNTWLAPYGDWMKEWPLWVAQYYNEPNRDRKPILPRGVDKWPQCLQWYAGRAKAVVGSWRAGRASRRTGRRTAGTSRRAGAGRRVGL
jgi:GH25 family lysozyme M1 (1,4-beta-N-acetylmuramidase)